ncbi:uncharacterized protein CELE_C31A11.13 [Caenorhabditis elegans]|uniref:Orphan protein n=1 Tax=Caenorhabditis elegans TaxID=6239 RepID=G3MU74_CAEEL|nr:uncharacterized protein CELE_C31A11.13 [Caenorhabditis elegans]CCD31039.1 Orphan protein [Caenorhabditis elegans]|eukprot:NP_001256702.1 Uncharacterized protein CELE_C31A11.13 [Caenorhabditis elegans]
MNKVINPVLSCSDSLSHHKLQTDKATLNIKFNHYFHNF